MTVSGAWSRCRKARPPKPPRLGRWQQVLADALDQNLSISVRPGVVDHLGRFPTRAELTAARRAAHSLAAPRSCLRAPCAGRRCGRQCRRPQLSDAGQTERDHERHPSPRTRVADSDAAGRKSPHNNAQTVRNPQRAQKCGRGCPAHQRRGVGRQIGCRRIGSLADAFIELRRLELRLDRRIRRDRDAWRVLQLVGSIPAPRLEPPIHPRLLHFTTRIQVPSLYTFTVVTRFW